MLYYNHSKGTPHTTGKEPERKSKMTYAEYMNAAKACRTYEEADALTTIAADDYTINARQYITINRAALKAAYEAH